MTTLQPGQLVTLSCGHFPRLIGRVERIVADSEPEPLSKDRLCQVNVGGTQTPLKRLSELRILCDRTDQIVACEDEIG